MENFAMKLLVFITVVIASCIDFIAVAGEMRESSDFDSFVTKYKKSYSKGSREYLKRRKVFEDNVRRHAELNEARNSSTAALYGVNAFADLTADEFRQRYLQSESKDGVSCGRDPQCETTDGAAIPDHWDWREKGVVTAIKNQETCGSCWAFGAVETIESHWAIRYGQLYDLSVQQVLDCTPGCSCLGCTTTAVFQWLQKNNDTLELSKVNPYSGKEKSCRRLATTPVRLTSHQCCGTNANQEFTQLRRVLYQHGPFATVINGGALKDYVGGIIQHHCPFNFPGMQEFHSVVVVGYDVTGDVPYWIVRNSWGSDFGEGGYFRLVIGHQMCGLGARNSYPII